jgi:hypothetical protein
MLIPVDKEVFTLANLARLAASRGQAALSAFCQNLTEAEIIQLREIGEELSVLASPIPHYTDPWDAVGAEFSKLVIRAEAKLTRHEARALFKHWIEILARRVDKKCGVIVRLLTMRPGRNVSQLARDMAKENEILPKNAQRGWDSTNETTLKRLIFRELQRFSDKK